jgi:hypothetical protein
MVAAYAFAFLLQATKWRLNARFPATAPKEPHSRISQSKSRKNNILFIFVPQGCLSSRD